ncbi:hypothetical protein [Rubneribacter sp.]|nr:hypothetical protein [Candidatus Rubneribacter avistercoris]
MLQLFRLRADLQFPKRFSRALIDTAYSGLDGFSTYVVRDEPVPQVKAL